MVHSSQCVCRFIVFNQARNTYALMKPSLFAVFPHIFLPNLSAMILHIWMVLVCSDWYNMNSILFFCHVFNTKLISTSQVGHDWNGAVLFVSSIYSSSLWFSFVFLFVLFLLWKQSSLCNPGCPPTQGDAPASAMSPVMGLRDPTHSSIGMY